MTPLLVVLPFHKGDAELARQLVTWMADLAAAGADSDKRYTPHSLLLVADKSAPRETVDAMMTIARPLFAHASAMFPVIPDDVQGWPKGPNRMFHDAMRQVSETQRLPFLWLEPDCVPITRYFLDRLAQAYERCDRKFMGCITESTATGGPQKHLPGCSIYPQDAFRMLKAFCNGDQPFDIANTDFILKRSRHTNLIQHLWGPSLGVSPRFVADDDAAAVKANGNGGVLTLSALRPEAVLFHRCKDGSLIDLLRDNLIAEPIAEVIDGPPVDPTAKPATDKKPEPPKPSAKSPAQPLPIHNR